MDLTALAKKEGISKGKLEKRVKNGSIVVMKNSKRNIVPVAIGAGVSTKINANIGTSPELVDLDLELEKAKVAIEYGSDTVMDLSIGGDTKKIRREILKKTHVPLGTVPIYEAFIRKKVDFTMDSVLKVVENQCREGVDFMTIHAGITKKIVDRMGERLIPITSRGGCFIAAWVLHNKKENPMYEHFDAILDIVKNYDVVISLGDALRPASIHDATDWCQLEELRNLGKLTKMARTKGVQVIIEGPGHLPLNHIEKNIKLEKKICDNAPFYVLGPLVTDIGVGHDHITGAIGGALAAMYGADFLCYVTPSEHLGLPNVEDVKNGVIASKIAAHAADIVKLKNHAQDDEMSHARKKLDWNKMFELSLDPKIKEKYANLKNKKECTMCGKYCALKILRNALKDN